MRIPFSPKPKKTLRENLRGALEALYDDFFRRRTQILNHPRRALQLHRMRIAGKPLRYSMELTTQLAGRQFASCYREMKELVELMGRTHDCDVHLPKLKREVALIKEYNALGVGTRRRVSAAPVAELMKQLRVERAQCFNEVCRILRRWERQNYRARLLAAFDASAPAQES